PTSTRPLPSFTLPRPPTSTFFPYTTLFRSDASVLSGLIMIFKRYRTSASLRALLAVLLLVLAAVPRIVNGETTVLSIDGYSGARDRKSTRLNSSHDQISYAVFCLKKKQQKH